MEPEFESWMRFYGKVSGSYRLEKGDFLSEKYQDAISSATYVMLVNLLIVSNKLCAWRHDMPPPLSSPVCAQGPGAPPSRCNVAVVSHAQYVLTVTAAPASCIKVAVSKADW